MGRIRMPKLFEGPEPCPPHEWYDPAQEPPENEWAHWVKHRVNLLCRKNPDHIWPDPRQVHPTEARKARY